MVINPGNKEPNAWHAKEIKYCYNSLLETEGRNK
jgi:hypothetical protein